VLLAAAGDGVCYGWDITEGRKQPVTRLRGHADLLHCVAARTGANQAVTGSEDGTARIWDCRSEKCTQVIDVWRAREAGTGGSGGGAAAASSSSGGGGGGGGSAGAWVGLALFTTLFCSQNTVQSMTAIIVLHVTKSDTREG
jgi:hypothetical protein